VGSPAPASASTSPPADSKYRYQFLPAFWTVTGILSLVVNGVLLSVLLIALQMLGAIQLTANDKTSSLLGGLYLNFLKMDEATIAANIPVQQMVPLNINVPVTITGAIADIKLTSPAVINNAHVLITEGGVQINADAIVTLPVGTPLTVEINTRNPFNLPVQAEIPVSLNVPVNIPLKNTELHEPFTGLQQVVRPLYCLVEPNALVNNVQICSPLITP
ncbi:MAG TPA: hypothetical protein VJ022_13710, partial [Anaerolineales bacterium]|nr:hypothetical protein [Anaerolineales bacterium]